MFIIIGNYFLNATKQCDVATKAGSRNHKVIGLTDIVIDDMRKFASKHYELNAVDSLHLNIINSLVEHQFPNGCNFFKAGHN